MFFTDVFPTARAVFHGDAEFWRYFGLVQVYDARTAGLGFAHVWTLCIEISSYAAVPLWALLWRRVRSVPLEVAVIVGLGLLSWGLRALTYARPSVVEYPHPPVGPSAWRFALLHVAYAAIALLMVLPFTSAGTEPHHEGPVGAFLDSRVMTHLGRVSYGVYLWHPFVILALLRLGLGTGSYLLAALATAACSVLLATLSYEPVERPALTFR